MNNSKNFGTAPVFFTAIATILGAILFLRFGFAVGTLGFWGTIVIILLGHLVTIPTALAISEIATNKRVEGGGEYFIISRSFGLNIGATIGIALYLSQAISVAFYVIAFTEAFGPVFDFVREHYGFELPRQAISIPSMLALSALILKKGANVGVKALYIVVGILFVALLLFFMGKTEFSQSADFSLGNAAFKNMDKFFLVFAIIFPAFTGMTAGVGLSGDLKKPSKSIPLGTVSATVIGMILYFFITWKFRSSASSEDLIADQLIMGKIALGGSFIILLGLAASTLSSAIGSVMVAPRTLQALASDRSLPSGKVNRILGFVNRKTGEPYNATVLTCIIALVFVALGDVNVVAQIISMFFMVTYGSLCLISFLNHFGSSPSYRPSFKSKWYISLIGFMAAFWLMFKMNFFYALAAIILMSILYMLTNHFHKNRKGLEAIFTNSLFQINRNMQVYLQKTARSRTNKEWRPSVICISRHTFKRDDLFRMLNWISYKYGFGTYIHLIDGYFSKSTFEESQESLQNLIKVFDRYPNQIYADTIISPSYTSAIAQSIQLPGISGMENNMVLFEFDKTDPNAEGLDEIIDNIALVKAGRFDVGILASSNKAINFKNEIHVWIRSIDQENSHLMILLSFIIFGHKDWKKSNIKIFDICKTGEEANTRTQMEELVTSGRLPITSKNIEIISEDLEKGVKQIINERSKDAGFCIIGFREESLKHEKEKLFLGYDEVGHILFINSHTRKEI
jgi:amino acid transporter